MRILARGGPGSAAASGGDPRYGVDIDLESRERTGRAVPGALDAR